MELPDRPTKDPYEEIPVKDFSYINQTSKPVKKTWLKWPYMFGAGLIILIILGAGGYLLLHHTKAKAPAKSSHVANTQSTSGPSTSANQSQPNVQLTPYSSSNFNLSVSYPNGWTVSDQNTTAMTITSPTGSMTDATGKTVSGRTVVTITNAGQLPTAFGSSTVAVLDSQLINYSNPTSSQLAKAYVSFAQYPATTTKGGLDGIYITGNLGYTKDQTIPKTDLAGITPLVIVSFLSCNSISCSSPTPLTISSSDWSNANFSTPILDILKSFSFT